MGSRLEGKNALVTGGGRGIGRSIALALAREGANVVVCDLGSDKDGAGTDRAPADEVVAECRQLGVEAVPHYGDVADFNAAEDMIRTCVDSFGRIDILCNMAGIGIGGMVYKMSEQEWDRVIAVHLKGTFNLTRHASALMRQQRYGRILNCTSDERRGAVARASFCAANGGIASLTYATAWEMGRYGVTCNAISPVARTRWLDDPDVIESFEWMTVAGLWTREMLEQTRHIAPPEHMGVIAAFLCSDAAGQINGCIFGTAGHKLSYWSPPTETLSLGRDWESEGEWKWEDVEQSMPALLQGYVNPAPARKRA